MSGPRRIVAMLGVVTLVAAVASVDASAAMADASVPGAPTIGIVVGGNGQATVSWTPPSSDGGSPIIVYVVSAWVGVNPAASVLAGSNFDHPSALRTYERNDLPDSRDTASEPSVVRGTARLTSPTVRRP
jgi:hypothetical protein